MNKKKQVQPQKLVQQRLSADDIGDRVNKFDSDKFDSFDSFDKYDSFDFS